MSDLGLGPKELPEIKKGQVMLVDIQYVRPNWKEKSPDYLYIIWKDLTTGEKYMKPVESPKMTFYMEKPELRDHLYNPTYQKLENAYPVTAEYQKIPQAIANELGEDGKRQLADCYNKKSGFRDFFASPYAFGADFPIQAWYRQKWMESYQDISVQPQLSYGFMDIEVDSLEVEGFAQPEFCPIDAVTLIDCVTKQSYTFALTGVDYREKNLDGLSQKEIEKEKWKQSLYASRMKQQEEAMADIPGLIQESHELFDKDFPGYDYKFFFYDDETKMIVHLFQLINQLKLDFIGIWNMGFDIPYIINRLKVLGLDPRDVMCHPDFPVKQCYYKEDTHNFDVKNNNDYFYCSSYTLFIDQMRNYAAIRKGQSEMRSYTLDYVSNHVIGAGKLDYSDDGNIKTVSYRNYKRYLLYNIKDVLLQCGNEEMTGDVFTFYYTSYANITPYDGVFKQTVLLRNAQYQSYMEQGLIPGENINAIRYNTEKHDDKKKKPEFDGALVGNPLLINNFGCELYGVPTNSIFRYSVDFDMSAFYPYTIITNNIDPSTLYFKVIIDSSQFDVRGGNVKYNGITDKQMVEENSDTFTGDIAKEVIDNYQTDNPICFCAKWMNLPDINDMCDILDKLV